MLWLLYLSSRESATRRDPPDRRGALAAAAGRPTHLPRHDGRLQR